MQVYNITKNDRSRKYFMRAFILIPLALCLYEILSLIVPLKISVWAKISASLLLLSGLAKSFLYRRTETGFDIVNMPYSLTLLSSVIFNFIIVALFMLVVKDVLWILCKLILRKTFPSHCASLFVFSIALCTTLYGTYEGLRVPDVKMHDVNIKGLGKNFDGMKVAMLVDIHADTLTDKAVVQKIVDKTNALKPDVILIPGDFVDGQVSSRSADVEPLSRLEAKYGVYGTTGNHEYYFDFRGWMNYFKDIGIKILENEHVILTSGDDKLILAGLPDRTGGMMGLAPHDIDKTLKNIPENIPVILMDHQPRAAYENAKHNVTFQVSGHTHGGQIPVIYTLVRKANNGFVRGWYDVDGMKLYVSPGTSQWNGFALRILDPSEISLFILHAE